MTTEDYVSFETAKLLKEKGFDDEYTNAFYDKSGILYFIDILSDFSEHPDNDTDIAASTLYAAMKWLREKKGIAIVPMISSILDHESFLWDVKIIVAKTGETYSQGWVYEKYENVIETSIKYCLKNLI